MKRWSKKFALASALLLLVLGGASCSTKPGQCMPCIPLPCCGNLQRPPVMTSQYVYVIDYNDCLGGGDCGSCGCDSCDCGGSCGCDGCQTADGSCGCAKSGTPCGCNSCGIESSCCGGNCGCDSCRTADGSCGCAKSGKPCGCDSCGCGKGRHKAFKDVGRYDPILDEYRAAIGDVLEISVFEDEDTTVENVVVAPDGRIYYLHLDGFVAEGKTLDEIRGELNSRLTDMFLVPNVSIIPRFMSNQTFTILGRVNQPGMFPLDRSVTVRQAIGLAGGLYQDPNYFLSGEFSISRPYQDFNRRSVNLKESFLVREGDKIGIDFERLVTSANDEDNIIVKPGDYIYIAGEETREIFILGNVFSPTALNYRDNMTLLGAMTMIGGWPSGTAYSADPTRVLVIRGNLDCPQCCVVNLKKILRGEARDLCLQPGDIIYVPDKPFRCIRDLVRLGVESFIAAFVNDAAAFYVDKLFD